MTMLGRPLAWSYYAIATADPGCLFARVAESLSAGFQMPPFVDLAVRLHAFPMAGNLVVYAFVSCQHRQILLPIPNTEACRADVKVKLVMWALNKLHHQHGLPDPWGLLALPSAVLFRILMCADSNSLLALACTCRSLQQAVDDGAVWRHRLQQDFGVEPLKVRSVGQKPQYASVTIWLTDGTSAECAVGAMHHSLQQR
jgi:hypothetical protein